MFDESLKPVPKKDVDYKTLPIHPTPEEYYLLSRVDGKSTISEICAISSMSKDKTMEALGRLKQAGLIEIPEPQKPAYAQSAMPNFGTESLEPKKKKVPVSVLNTPTASEPASAKPSPVAPKASSSDDPYAFFPTSMKDFKYDDALFADDSIELETTQKKELIYVHAHLEVVDYYALMGIARDVPRKSVREAFFALSKKFHPDLFYGRSLGPFEEMVGAIFLQINTAQRILSHKKKRAAYDETLPSETNTAQSVSTISEASAPKDVTLDPAEQKKRDMAFALLVRRGEKCEMSGELIAAAAEYKKAFGLKHDSTVALRGANLLLRSGHEHYEQAILLALAAYKADRTRLEALLLVGDAYEELERLDDAIRYYDKILTIDPQNKTASQRKRYVQSQQL